MKKGKGRKKNDSPSGVEKKRGKKKG